MFDVYYSDDDYDHLFSRSLSLFEATCEYYNFMNSDWNEGHELVTIRDEDNNIIKQNY